MQPKKEFKEDGIFCDAVGGVCAWPYQCPLEKWKADCPYEWTCCMSEYSDSDYD